MENKEMKVPELVLEPNKETTDATQTPQKDSIMEEELRLDRLSEPEQKQVHSFADQIDLNNSNIVLQYGAAAQGKIASFSESILDAVRTKDLGDIGESLTSLVTELKGFQIDEEDKGIFGFFKKQANKATVLKAKYDKAEVNVDQICTVLEKHQVQLMSDVAMLDQLYDMNLQYFKEITMYILAGKEKLEVAKNEELPKLMEAAKASTSPEDTQKANDYASMIARFEKKLYDLELSRNVSLQMSPQIRLVQNNDVLMSEKIQSSLVNTIPLWKSQMVLALGVANATKAMEAQRAVTDTTNELLRKNADTLKQSTIDTMEESERGIVDIETLQHTNESLISTLDEIQRIQDEGRAKRADAEIKLQQIENELKAKLLDVKA